MNPRKILLASGGGLAGAAMLNVLHETLRKQVPNAPRMDLLGMQVLEKTLAKKGDRYFRRKKLRRWALMGDLLSNTLYYSWIYSPSRSKSWRKGMLLGTLAGLGAVWLPGPLHLQKSASNRTEQTKWMTIALYLTGALTAAATQNLFKKS